MIDIITSRKIQILRAIAIISVVFIHANATGIIAVIDRPFINFAVALFLFISGYLTKTKYENTLNFYKKRIFKVLVPYLIWSVLYLAFTNNLNSIFKAIISGGAAIPFYYIIVYVQFVILTPLIGKLIDSKYRIIGYFITPVSIIVIRYLMVFFNITLSFPFPSENFLVWFIYYYLGMGLGNNKIKYTLNMRKLFNMYLVTILISLIEGLVWYSFNNVDMAISQIRISSILTSVCVCLIANRFIKDKKYNSLVSEGSIGKYLVSIGNISFGIFFIHMLFIIAITKYLPIVDIFPIKMILTVVLSIVSVLIGEKLLGKYSQYLGF